MAVKIRLHMPKNCEKKSVWKESFPYQARTINSVRGVAKSVAIYEKVIGEKNHWISSVKRVRQFKVSNTEPVWFVQQNLWTLLAPKKFSHAWKSIIVVK